MKLVAVLALSLYCLTPKWPQANHPLMQEDWFPTLTASQCSSPVCCSPLLHPWEDFRFASHQLDCACVAPGYNHTSCRAFCLWLKVLLTPAFFCLSFSFLFSLWASTVSLVSPCVKGTQFLPSCLLQKAIICIRTVSPRQAVYSTSYCSAIFSESRNLKSTGRKIVQDSLMSIAKVIVEKNLYTQWSNHAVITI